MVMVGGITRLTNSGLSMTDWHLVTDTFPPLSEEKWVDALKNTKNFQNTRKSTFITTLRFLIINSFIFGEWFHRFIGRIIGIVFIIPFVYFLIEKEIHEKTIKKCIVLLGMGAFQGFLGWFMVRSGLIDNPDVSHFRLALHLTFAFITFAYTLWVALDLMYPEKNDIYKSLRTIARVALVALILQIIYGGFVAGLNAGLIHNHWPLMSEGKLIHENRVDRTTNTFLKI